MEDKIITVIVQGETDIIILHFKKLEKSNESEFYKTALPFYIGKMLDGNPTLPLSAAAKAALTVMLANYVPDLDCFDMAGEFEFEAATIVITAFRKTRDGKLSYLVRAGGIIPANMPLDFSWEDGYRLVLDVINGNQRYLEDDYDEGSAFYQLLEKAKETR